jgi:Zn-dependent peptidase ImmA (M78 family)
MKKSFMVYGKKIKVKMVKTMPPEHYNAAGLYMPATGEILILKGLDPHIEKEVLYHELFHAIMDRIGLWQAKMSSDVHEILCEAFSRYVAENFNMKR